VTSLLATGFSGQEILDFACFLEYFYNNTELLIADVNKYGSVKRLIEVISQKYKNPESQAKPTAKRDSMNIKNEINDDGKTSDCNFSYPQYSVGQIRDSSLSTNSTHDSQASR
jgi:hypothetical protein